MKKLRILSAIILVLILLPSFGGIAAASGTGVGAVWADDVIAYLDDLLISTPSLFPSGSYTIHDSTFTIEDADVESGYVAIDMDEDMLWISITGLTEDRSYFFTDRTAFLIAFGLTTTYIDANHYASYGLTFYLVEGGQVRKVSPEEVSTISSAFQNALLSD